MSTESGNSVASAAIVGDNIKSWVDTIVGAYDIMQGRIAAATTGEPEADDPSLSPAQAISACKDRYKAQAAELETANAALRERAEATRAARETLVKVLNGQPEYEAAPQDAYSAAASIIQRLQEELADIQANNEANAINVLALTAAGRVDKAGHIDDANAPAVSAAEAMLADGVKHSPLGRAAMAAAVLLAGTLKDKEAYLKQRGWKLHSPGGWVSADNRWRGFVTDTAVRKQTQIDGQAVRWIIMPQAT